MIRRPNARPADRCVAKRDDPIDRSTRTSRPGAGRPDSLIVQYARAGSRVHSRDRRTSRRTGIVLETERVAPSVAFAMSATPDRHPRNAVDLPRAVPPITAVSRSIPSTGSPTERRMASNASIGFGPRVVIRQHADPGGGGQGLSASGRASPAAARRRASAPRGPSPPLPIRRGWRRGRSPLPRPPTRRCRQASAAGSRAAAAHVDDVGLADGLGTEYVVGSVPVVDRNLLDLGAQAREVLAASSKERAIASEPSGGRPVAAGRRGTPAARRGEQAPVETRGGSGRIRRRRPVRQDPACAAQSSEAGKRSTVERRRSTARGSLPG